MDLPLDRYTIGARLAPVWIVFLPAAFVAGVFLGKESIEAGLAVWLGTAVALTALFAQLGRAGRRLEPRLFAWWGGAPTTAYLRHVGSPLDPNTRDRIVRKLAAMIPGIRWPTPQDEAADPAAADQVYESAVLYIRERTRDPERFRLVFAENASYGFRRNLWAMKPTARCSRVPAIWCSPRRSRSIGAPARPWARPRQLGLRSPAAQFCSSYGC